MVLVFKRLVSISKQMVQPISVIPAILNDIFNAFSKWQTVHHTNRIGDDKPRELEFLCFASYRVIPVINLTCLAEASRTGFLLALVSSSSCPCLKMD